MSTPVPQNWFRFTTRAWFRLSPGPGWAWPPVPIPADDEPVSGWPSPEYLALKAALSAGLLRDSPTLNYEDAMGGGPRSLMVTGVVVEPPLSPDDTNTALARGTLVFETACFTPVEGAGPGARLGEWLAWVEVEHAGMQAGMQLQSLTLLSAQAVDPGAPLQQCEMTGGRLYVRPAG